MVQSGGKAKMRTTAHKTTNDESLFKWRELPKPISQRLNVFHNARLTIPAQTWSQRLCNITFPMLAIHS
jgi:hypothetical protein